MTESHVRADGREGLARLRRYTWAFLVPFPGVAALAGALQLGQYDRPLLNQALILVAFAVAAAVGTWAFHTATMNDDAEPLNGRELTGFIVAASVLILALIPAAPVGPVGLGWVLLTGALIGAVVVRLPPRSRLPGLLLMTLGTVAVTVVLAWQDQISTRALIATGVVVLCSGIAVWLQWWNFDIARQLEQARRIAGELAVAEERLRFAAELHDIQGHHLQVIALKSELAVRLAPHRPQDSIAQMQQVHDLAREALVDTRAVVAGYRRVSLHTEITNATRVLNAAGIQAQADLPGGTVEWEPETERLMGLLVREATTNILRHADSRFADYRLEADQHSAAIRIRNDGASPADHGGGTGLTALSERFQAANGTLRWRHEDGRFLVSAALPLISPRNHDTETKDGDPT